MSKSVSYYDWELSFKKKADHTPNNPRLIKKPSLNSIGIPVDNFKEFMKKWKQENL